MPEEKLKEIPLIIENDYNVIFGVLRKNEKTDKLVIFIPAITGSRIGPQRIFIETARKLLKNDIASLCVELPGSGDSYFKNNITEKNIFKLYFSCLDNVLNYLKGEFNEVVLVSISIGCIPVYSYALKNSINKVVLLSPALLDEDQDTVNKENIHKYYQKLFTKETWLKILFLKLNIKKIIFNIVDFEKIKSKLKRNKNLSVHQSDVPFNNDIIVYSVYGGNDMGRETSNNYFEQHITEKKIKNYRSFIVNGSDHSFFGWNFKNQVSDIILEVAK